MRFLSKKKKLGMDWNYKRKKIFDEFILMVIIILIQDSHFISLGSEFWYPWLIVCDVTEIMMGWPGRAQTH